MKRIRFRSRQSDIKPQADVYPYNDKIRVPEVRLIDENNEMLGVMSTKSALELAKEREYDLVLVSPKAEPPVAKLSDYGKFKYEQEKMKKKQLAQKKGGELKVIRLSLRIGQHDRDVREKQCVKFLTKGDKVKFELRLKGREKQHSDLALTLLRDILASIKLSVEYTVEQEPKQVSFQFTAVIAP